MSATGQCSGLQSDPVVYRFGYIFVRGLVRCLGNSLKSLRDFPEARRTPRYIQRRRRAGNRVRTGKAAHQAGLPQAFPRSN